MSGIPLAALSVRPPEQQPGVLDQYGKALQLKSLMNAQAMQPLQQQELQQQVEGQKRALDTQSAVQKSYSNAVKPNAQGQPEIDTDALTQGLASSGHGDAIPSILENINKFQKSKADLTEAQQKIQANNADTLGYAASAIQAAKYDPKVAHTILDTLPGTQQITALRQQIDTNPDGFKQIVDNAVKQSPALQKMQNEKDVATIRAQGKPPEGELPLPNPDQMNQVLATRFQVLNPGQPLPPQFTLPPNATQADYKRIDSSLEGVEKAQGTKAQQDTANAMRKQTEALAAQGRADQEEKQGQQPVTGTDANGRDVLVSAADAKKMNLTGVMKADADMVNKSTAARHWLPLAEKKVEPQLANPNDAKSPATNADQMGILQLIDRLDSRGQLGVVASRWNEFLAGKVGEGDPEITALRAKMGLSNTKLMQAHVGSRGGAFMLEHFEDLANAKKMDANTLRTGVKSELDYMKDVAMQPDKPGGASKSAASSSGVPANVSKALANIGPGIHTLSDGSTWMKNADGSIAKQ